MNLNNFALPLVLAIVIHAPSKVYAFEPISEVSQEDSLEETGLTYSLRKLQWAGRKTCTTASLKGTYLYSGQGMTLLAEPLPSGYQYFPYAETGIEIYDGKGNVKNIYSNTENQGMVTETATYTINEHCEGTVTYSSGSVFKINLGPDGKSFTFIQVGDPSRIYSGEQTRVSSSTTPKCSNKTLNGTYSYFGQGSNSNLVLYVQTGLETYNGNGILKNRYVDNITQTAAFDSATYTISSDCTGKVTYASGDIFNIFVSPSGDEFVYIQEPNGVSMLSGKEQRVSTLVLDLGSESTVATHY